MEGRLTRALAETLGIAESLLGKWAPGASSKVKVRSSSATPANGSGHHGERCLEVASQLRSCKRSGNGFSAAPGRISVRTI